MSRRHALRTVVLLAALLAGDGGAARAEDGYELWLRYRLVAPASLLAEYRSAITHLIVPDNSAIQRSARAELALGLRGLLGVTVPFERGLVRAGGVIAGTPRSSTIIAGLNLAADLRRVGEQGFLLRSTTVNGRPALIIAANQDVGVLYGVFALLRQLQTHGSLRNLNIVSAPRIQLRVLNHWDNLDRSVERGYAGASLWDWHKLPDYSPPRYRDYARANAAIGINGTVLTNVNANAVVMPIAALARA